MRPGVLETGEVVRPPVQRRASRLLPLGRGRRALVVPLVESGGPTRTRPDRAPRLLRRPGRHRRPARRRRPGASPSASPSPSASRSPSARSTLTRRDDDNATTLARIATVGAYAAHPVTADESAGIADADFPAVFAPRRGELRRALECSSRPASGNVSPRGNKVEMGKGLCHPHPGHPGAGTVIDNPDVRGGPDLLGPAGDQLRSDRARSSRFLRPAIRPRSRPRSRSVKTANKPCNSASPRVA